MPRVIWITMVSTLITGCVCSPMTGTRVLTICMLSRCEIPPRHVVPIVPEAAVIIPPTPNDDDDTDEPDQE